jgi:UPF0271 protein
MPDIVQSKMEIDLNADIGEGYDDRAIVPWLSSANISCGAHAGSEAEIRQALQLCKQHNVAVGAHPSYPDRQNFGRKALDMPLPELRVSLGQQLDYFLKLTAEKGVAVCHLKAHGALYNVAAQDPQLGAMLLELCSKYQLPLMTLAQSPLHLAALQQQLPVIAEAFADRAYQANGQLVSRAHAGALLTADAAISQSLQLVQQRQVQALSGDFITLHAESLCLHGDSPQAVTLSQKLHQAMLQQHILIKAKTFKSFSSEAPWTL